MVTKRARRWMQRGVTAGLLLAALGLGIATWFASEAIEADLLTRVAAEPAGDPSDAGLAFRSVDVPGPLGNYPAWLIGEPVDGEPAPWAIVVHDGAESRDAALDLVPVLADRGFVVVIPTYRGDAGAPPAPGGHHGLGAAEWEDVEAAVRFAVTGEPSGIVLVGRGTGGSAVLTLLRESESGAPIRGAIVDAAYLDPGTMVDRRMERDNVPGFLKGWAKALATFRFGVEWAVLDQIAGAADLAVPVLLIHGTADERVPVELADRMAGARPDLITYLRVDGAGHLGAWEADAPGVLQAAGEFLDVLFPVVTEVVPVERETPPE